MIVHFPVGAVSVITAQIMWKPEMNAQGKQKYFVFSVTNAGGLMETSKAKI